MGAPGPGPAEPLSGRRPCPQGHVSGPELRLLQSTLGRVCLCLRGQAVSVAGARVFSHRGERESPRVGLGAESDSGLGWTLLKLGGVRVGRALGSLREVRFLGEGCGAPAKGQCWPLVWPFGCWHPVRGGRPGTGGSQAAHRPWAVRGPAPVPWAAWPLAEACLRVSVVALTQLLRRRNGGQRGERKPEPVGSDPGKASPSCRREACWRAAGGGIDGHLVGDGKRQWPAPR